MNTKSSRIIALATILSIYFLFMAIVGVLIFKNKLRFRHNQQIFLTSSGYKLLASDIELADRAEESDNGVLQLPTDADGGEALDGRPNLQPGHNPVHRLEGNEV